VPLRAAVGHHCRVDQDGLRWRADVEVGAWIAPRLGPFGGRVSSVVPRGFAAYARVLHPVRGHASDEVTTTWAGVCAVTGQRPHPLMQWHAISGRPVPGAEPAPLDVPWPGGDPDTGDLGPDALAALVAVLQRHTTPDAECVFALWEGYGWIHGSPSVMSIRLGGDGTTSLEDVSPAYPPDVLAGPRLHHPHRDYILFSGPLQAAGRLGVPSPWTQSPNLFWPADRAWCVASEIDFDSTLVGGSRKLIDGVLAAPELEAWAVGPEDSLAIDGDTVNIRPAEDIR
jgi:hypothetical protein